MSATLTPTTECVTASLVETPHGVVEDEVEDDRPLYGGRVKTTLLMLVILACICGAIYF
jgi:hypothetical protein